MCHKAPNASSPTHTYTYTLLRWRKSGNRGDREDGVEDWGWGRWRGRWRQTHGVPAGVVPPSRDSYFTICLTEHTHKNTPAPLLSQSSISHVFVSVHTLGAHTHTRSYTCTHTHAGVTVRQMSGGSSQCNSPPWPNTDSSRHLRQLPLSQWKEPIWIWCQKKQSTVAELWKRLLNWGFIYSNAFSLLDWIES